MRYRRWVLLAALCAPGAGAQVQTYHVAPGLDGPGIEISLPYPTGVHSDSVRRIAGELRLDPAAAVASGTLSVPIDSIASDQAERDCHMREALGLDYSRSRYPKEHVCNDNRLPAGAVAFPEILLRIERATAPALASAAPGKEVPVATDATWTIHGVTRPARLQLTASRAESPQGALRIRGSSTIRLADFDVVVKSARALFITISVGDSANVKFDLMLTPAR
jgi:polyisoprenoid-binding protein YceI